MHETEKVKQENESIQSLTKAKSRFNLDIQC